MTNLIFSRACVCPYRSSSSKRTDICDFSVTCDRLGFLGSGSRLVTSSSSFLWLCCLDRLFEVNSLDIQSSFQHFSLIDCSFVAFFIWLQAIVLGLVPFRFLLIEGNRLQV